MTEKSFEFRIWQNKLYNLQREAPSPHAVPCTIVLANRPPQYGIEYHGPLTRQETEKLLETAPDGSYLIRDSQRAENSYTLVIWFDKVARNYKLFFDNDTRQHFVGETKFDSVDLLVADGLIHFYVETRGAEVLKKIAEANIYKDTPFYKTRYHTFNAQVINACLNSKSTDYKTMTNERPLPSPLKHIQASERYKSPTKRVLSTHRQSLDVSQLNSNIQSKQSTRDWPVTYDRSSADGHNEIKNYRNFPPLAIKKFANDTHPALNSPSCETTFSNLRLGPSIIKQNIPNQSQNSKTFQPQTCTVVSSFGENNISTNNVDNTPVTSRAIRRHAYHSVLFMLPDDISSSTSQPAIPRLVNSNIITSSCECKPLVDHYSPDNSGLSHAPLATCFSGESSSIGSFTNESCDSRNSNNTTDMNKSHDLEVNSSPDLLSLPNSTSYVVGPKSEQTFFNGDLSCISKSNGAMIMNNTSNQLDQNDIKSSEPEDVPSDAMRNLQERYNLPAACLPDSSTIISEIKPHNFKVHTYLGPHWCDYCTHFIWGLVAQGMKCSDCGFQAHKRCADRVPCDCLPDVKQMKRVFGVDLTSLSRAEKKPVPIILSKCINEIERRGGLASEGLYRVPGNRDLVEDLRIDFDKDSELANIGESRVRDVNTLASLIKLFLRQLPVPLITYEIYPELIEVIRKDQLVGQEKLDALKKLLIHLPVAHYESLRYFINHIHRVAERCEVNMMTTNNLATVLAPTLMISSYTDPISLVTDTQFERALVGTLIDHNQYLLPELEKWQPRPNEFVNNIQNSPNHRHSQIIIPTSPVLISSPPPINTCGNSSSSKKWTFLRSRVATLGPPPSPDNRIAPNLSQSINSNNGDVSGDRSFILHSS